MVTIEQKACTACNKFSIKKMHKKIVNKNFINKLSIKIN